ncbi:MAG TPA: ABC transporter permease [Alphaproteobacteria bacterium]|nr:ABC transporter permease [Alphaproteobacteria bacterium]
MNDPRNEFAERVQVGFLMFMESVRRDVSVTLRSLVAKPGFTLLVVLSLGLGIGANTAIFSFMDGVLLRPISVPHPHDLATLDTAASRVTKFGDSSYLDYVDYAKQSKDFQGMLVYRRILAGMVPDPKVSDAQSAVVWGLLVSGNYFSLLEVKPVLGRDFLPEEDQNAGKAPVAILSYGLWQRMFHGDRNVIGSTVKLNGHLYTVIGVTPKSFTGLDLAYRPDIYVPMAMIGDIVPLGGNQLLQSRQSRSFIVRGRLRPGVTISQAQAEADVIGSNLIREYPTTNKDIHFIVRRELDYRMEGSATTLPGVALPAVLMGLVVLVLLIACANVASLLMARATGRLRGIATQLALGATRARLLRQLMTESTVLAFLGGACGLALAWLGIQLATDLVPYTPAPQGPLFQMDTRVMMYAMAASAATVILCGLAPAFMATREAARAALRVRSSSSRGFGVLARRAFIGCQVALSVILLIAGGLFLKAFTRLQTFDLGFNPNNVFVVSMNPSFYNYSTAQTAQFYRELLDRTTTIQGVKSASLAAIPPFLGLYSWDISIDGYTTPGGDKVVDTLTDRISPEFFQTLQIPFLKGRNFTENDKADSPKVAIVNETFARRFIVGTGELEGAMGHIFRRRDNAPIQIVGIVKNSVYGVNTPLGSEPAPVFYIPALQFADSYMSIIVRTEGPLKGIESAIRKQMSNLDPAIAPIYSISLSTVVSDRSLYMPRVTAVMSGIFAIIALTLAIIGLYGVVSYSVECRTQEIGIRMALGAQKRSVLGMILASSLSLVLFGLAVGIIGALALAPYITTLLVGVNPRDPVTFILLPLVMLAATVVASLVPASRATRVEPVTALRYE